MNTRNLIILFTTIIILTACSSAHEFNGFGGTRFSENPQKSIQEFGQDQIKSSVEINGQKDQNIACISQLDTTTKTIEIFSFKENRVSKFQSMKLKKSKFETGNTSIQKTKGQFLPNKRATIGYWYLFAGFILFGLMGIGFIIAEIVAGGGGSYFGVLGVFGILHSLIQLLGLRKYEKIKEHGFFYSFGFWTSMFGWWFIGIPLFLWLIISLLS